MLFFPGVKLVVVLCFSPLIYIADKYGKISLLIIFFDAVAELALTIIREDIVFLIFWKNTKNIR